MKIVAKIRAGNCSVLLLVALYEGQSKACPQKVKQQILSFCLRHNYRFDSTANHWTQAHLKWLKALKPEGLYIEILWEYLLTYDNLIDKLERFDKRIKELSSSETYQENVRKLSC